MGVFYSYPVEVVADWCSVSLATAASWKCGVAKPSRQALRLFELHRDGRVLSVDAWTAWRVQEDRLVDPEGNSTTQGQLRAYAVAIRLFLEMARVGSKWSKVAPELAQVRELLGGSEARSGAVSDRGRLGRRT
jgi:Phage protein